MESSGAVTVGVAIITRDDLGPLKDLLAQVSGFDQVVVVDTGSRDGTRRYVKQLGPPYELHEIKWRPRSGDHQPDEWGFAAARAESFAHLKTTMRMEHLKCQGVDGVMKELIEIRNRARSKA